MTTNRVSYLTTAEAAEYLRLSKQFLEIARHRGDGPPYIQLARAVRYSETRGSGRGSWRRTPGQL